MYAIVEFKGNQYKVEKDAVLDFPYLKEKEGETITVDTVLLVSDGDRISVGTPYVEGAKVSFEVGKSFRGKKVLVLKYKPKKDYHRLIGHREQYTKVNVKDIALA